MESDDIVAPPSKLAEKTRELLLEKVPNPTKVWRDTGIPPQWLYLLKKGKITNPSAARIEQLFFYLGGTWGDLG